MQTIPTNRIVSAFQNMIEYEKVEQYTEVMQAEMLSHKFPAIIGFESIIDEQDVTDGICFLTGEEVDESHIGQRIWKVTDGHHRTLAAINACLPYLEVERDYSTITDENDL